MFAWEVMSNFYYKSVCLDSVKASAVYLVFKLGRSFSLVTITTFLLHYREARKMFFARVAKQGNNVPQNWKLVNVDSMVAKLGNISF